MLEQPVLYALYIGIAGVIFELLGSILRPIRLRQLLYVVVLLTTVYSATVFTIWYLSVPAILLALVAAYRLLNGFRVVHARMQPRRAYQVTRRSSWVLLLFQSVSVVFLYLSEHGDVNTKEWLFALMLIALMVLVVLLAALRRNLKRAAIRPSDRYTADMDLPTVSVCIPARNETEQLAACLASVVASDYPKLEVLVLDDCSHHTTSEIIRGLAQDGVRFINGVPPRTGWLAKNQAYDELAQSASGELLLFIGVDVRLDKRAISVLVASMHARKKSMISLLPVGLQKLRDSGLVQPMRYWWELALPRRLFNRPPALSTAWIIKREALEAVGGFQAVNNTVIPESYFARELAKTDSYSFMRASNRLKVQSVKNLEDQWETAVRMRYPQLRQRPETVLLLTVAELVVLLLPIAVFITGFFVPLGLLWLLSGIITIIIGFIHYQIINAWQIARKAEAIAALPFAVVLELLLLQISMYKYEFGVVVWKDRNICIPVMKAVPHLPKF